MTGAFQSIETLDRLDPEVSQSVAEVPCSYRSSRHPAANSGCKRRKDKMEVAKQIGRAFEIADFDRAEDSQQCAGLVRARRTSLPVDPIDGRFETSADVLDGKALLHVDLHPHISSH
jgi:hypothetical protein